VVFRATDPVTHKPLYKVHAYGNQSLIFDGVFEDVADLSGLPKKVRRTM
jgi:hypothetical protein